MAENESLDIYKSPRWQRLLHSILSGMPPAELAVELERSFHRAIRNVQQLINKCGVGLAELLRAARRGPDAINPYLRKCRDCRDYVEMLILASDHGKSQQAIVSDWIGGISGKLLDRFKVHVAINAVPSLIFPDLANLSAFMTDIESRVEPEFSRIAQNLAANPNWRPTAKRSTPANRAPDPTDRILKTSLLGIEPHHGGNS